MYLLSTLYDDILNFTHYQVPLDAPPHKNHKTLSTISEFKISIQHGMCLVVKLLNSVLSIYR